jgi:hypothetical protein
LPVDGVFEPPNVCPPGESGVGGATFFCADPLPRDVRVVLPDVMVDLPDVLDVMVDLPDEPNVMVDLPDVTCGLMDTPDVTCGLTCGPDVTADLMDVLILTEGLTRGAVTRGTGMLMRGTLTPAARALG